jgi:serine/threonine protein kinase
VTPRTNPFPDDAVPPMAVEVPVGPEAPSGYKIVKHLGRGGMGDVYLVHNQTMDRHEVLKVIQPALISQPEARERFQQEVRNAARLHHPNIVTAYSCLPVGDGLAFAMEYVPGRDLHAVVRANGPLSVVAACHYIRQAALGLQHAHERGMVHRDVKPHNLMLGQDGNKPVIKVLDFGLAKSVDAGSYDRGLTGTNQMMGTPEYVAPEQILDAAKADIRADVYSLGCTLYHLLAGHSPFAGLSLYETLEAHHFREPAPLPSLRTDVPVDLDAVVRKMMAKAPAERYQTPGEVAQALTPFLKSAKGSKAPAVAPKQPRLTAWFIGAGLLALTLAVGGLWAAGVFKPKPDPGPTPEIKPKPEEIRPKPEEVKPKITPPSSGDRFSLAARRGPERAKQLALWGGTKESEAAVTRGLAWLMSQQKADSSWPTDPWAEDPVASTSLALLALLGAGHVHQGDHTVKYKPAVEAGLKYLIARQKPDGSIRTGEKGLSGHARATAVLCEALEMTGDNRLLLAPAKKAVKFIVEAQAEDGSWGALPGEPGSVVSVAAQVAALAAARRCKDIVVPAETWRRASRYLDTVAGGPAGGRFGFRSTDLFPLPTAFGLFARMHTDDWGPDNPGMIDGVQYLLDQPPPKAGTFNPTWVFFQSQVMRQHGGDAWHKTWNPAVRDLLIARQGKDGFWEATALQADAPPGRHTTTALAVLILETYYRFTVSAK